jgi:hypothetical protein
MTLHSCCKHLEKKEERTKAEITPPSLPISESAAEKFLAADF